MGYYEPDTNYYEPTEAEIIFDNAKAQLVEILKKDITNEIKIIKDENISLKEQIQKYKDKERDLHNREIKIGQREKTALNDIYRKTFSEILKPLEDNFIAYRIANRYIKNPKCNKCDENREIEYTSKYGEIIKKHCECSKTHIEYYVDETTITTINLFKGNSKFKATPKYDLKDYDNSYSKLEFQGYLDEFDLARFKAEGVSEYNLQYNTVWTNREACQQCCDYFNSNIFNNYKW